MTNITYRILFEIQVLLQDYSEVLLNDIEVIPSEPTVKILSNYRLKYTWDNNAIYVHSEIVTTNKNETRIKLPSELEFEFNMKFKNSKFQSFYSNLSQFDLENNVFLFDNKTGIKDGSDLYISTDFNAYSNANTYKKGYLTTHSGNLFLCLQSNDASNPKPTSDVAFWAPLTNRKFISQSNLVPRNSLATVVDGITYPNIEKDEFAKIRIYNTGISADYEITTPVDASTADDIAAGRTIMGTLPNKKKFILQFKNYKNS